MSKISWELWGIIIVIIEFNINYFIYIQTKSLVNILIIAVTSLIIALVFIFSHIYSKIDEIFEKSNEINQKLIRYKELEDIRLDIRELKREMSKKK